MSEIPKKYGEEKKKISHKEMRAVLKPGDREYIMKKAESKAIAEAEKQVNEEIMKTLGYKTVSRRMIKKEEMKKSFDKIAPTVRNDLKDKLVNTLFNKYYQEDLLKKYRQRKYEIEDS